MKLVTRISVVCMVRCRKKAALAAALAAAAAITACAGNGSVPSSAAARSLDTAVKSNRSIVRPASLFFTSPGAATKVVRVLGYAGPRSLFGGNCSSKRVALVSLQRYTRNGARFDVKPEAAGTCKESFANEQGIRGVLSIVVGL